METTVKVRSLTKAFGEGDSKTVALKGVDLDVRPGELLMIVGPSGCGKTTLLSIIAGTLMPDQGEVEVFGSPLHTMSTRDVTRFRGQNIGFIFQQFNLIPTLNCMENVSVPMIVNGHKRREAEDKARTTLDHVGIPEKAAARPNALSGGQQQRVAIARAIVHEPRLVICDEPTSALDGETGAKIMELLSHLAKSAQRSVIVVTHDNRIFKFADRIVEMEDGRIRGEMHPQTVGVH